MDLTFGGIKSYYIYTRYLNIREILITTTKIKQYYAQSSKLTILALRRLVSIWWFSTSFRSASSFILKTQFLCARNWTNGADLIVFWISRHDARGFFSSEDIWKMLYFAIGQQSLTTNKIQIKTLYTLYLNNIKTIITKRQEAGC